MLKEVSASLQVCLTALSPCRATIETDGWLHVSQREHVLAFILPGWSLCTDNGELARGHELAMTKKKCIKIRALKCRHPRPYILYYFVRCLGFNFITH